MPAPRKMIHMGSGWDPFFADDTYRDTFVGVLELIVGFRGSSQWNRHVGWGIPSYDYQNTFSESHVSYEANQLDSDGGALWLPFGTPSEGAGTYSRRSQDLRSEVYRAGFADACIETIDAGAAGMFFDDVNLDNSRMFKRTGGGVPLTDFDSGAYYTSPINGLTGWKALLGDFHEDVIARVRAVHPQAKFIFNPVWTDLSSGDFVTDGRWRNPAFKRVLQLPDWIIIEHGHSDSGLNSGAKFGPTGAANGFALRAQLAYVDAVHEYGTGVILYVGSDNSQHQRDFEMAAWLSHRTSVDLLGLWEEDVRWPDYDPVFDTDLGIRTGIVDSNIADTMIRADFTGGYVEYTPAETDGLPVVISEVPIPPPPPYEAAVLADSPIAYWKLDEVAGVFDDLIGTRDLTADPSTGVLTRGVDPLVGLPGTANKALSLSGPARAWCPHDVGLRLVGDFTIECWAKVDTGITAFPPLIRKGTGTGLGGWQLYVITSNGNLAFKRDNIDTNLNPAQLSDLVKKHIVITYDSVALELKAYLDGQLLKTVSITYTASATDTSALEIGTGAGTPERTIDQVALYASKLSAARIAEHYAAGVAESTPPSTKAVVLGTLQPVQTFAMVGGVLVDVGGAMPA